MFVFGLGDRTPYDHNVGILKKYSETNYRLTVMKAIRMAGYEERNPSPQDQTWRSRKHYKAIRKSRSLQENGAGACRVQPFGNTS